MLKKIKFRIKGIKNENCKFLIETEVDVLGGVKDALVDWKRGEGEVEFDSEKTDSIKIFNSIERLGYKVLKEGRQDAPSILEHTYFTRGMHCPSCEILIEKRLLEEKNIQAVEASVNQGKVLIEYEGERPTTLELNKIFEGDGYTFLSEKSKDSNSSFKELKHSDDLVISKHKFKDFLIILGISLLLIIGFIFLHRSGLSARISVNASSALPMFFVFGVLAGLSSCAALVGGIVLSMSKQWSEVHAKSKSTIKKLEPHFLFNLGRLVSYGVLGAVFGAVGKALQLSLTFTSILMFAVSVMMLFLALQMLGVKYFQRFQITAPKFITRYAADETNFRGKYMPSLMGAATFFLPCGFTITAQGLALASGSVWQGGLIMLFFALGTLPMLLGIGFSSVKFSRNPKVASRFLKVAGVLVLFFALFNINAQLNVLGLRSLDDISLKGTAMAAEAGLPEIINGKQILKTDALSYAYEPNYLKVKVGVPVRWEIADKGTSGCTNAIMSRGLFEGEIPLTPGQTSVKEFTPEKTGKYKFSCWMGMISGIIEVVDDTGSTAGSNEIIESGAKGCGCGGGDSGTCGGG
ncbi:sulfite exporter TauE/SafE family protein [Candidatus Falkowbacteria bacterium]|nr:sulfite exporter TauE/SafE family protein [Candidatus Falkowbacteria bacterium]